MLCSQLCCVAGSSPLNIRVRALRTQHNCLEGAEEGEQRWVVFPSFVGGGCCAEGVGVGEDFRFTLQIDFGVDVGGVDGDVTEPCADGVDIDAGAEQMRSRSVADGVRADRPAKQRWMRSRCGADMVAEHPVNAVTCDRIPKPVQKDGLVGRPVANKGEQCVDGRRPERAPSNLASLTSQLYVAELVGTQVQVGDQ